MQADAGLFTLVGKKVLFVSPSPVGLFFWLLLSLVGRFCDSVRRAGGETSILIDVLPVIVVPVAFVGNNTEKN